MLIAVEGVDGAGKRTLTVRLRAAFQAVGKSVVTLAFPRYGRSVTADIAAEALHGQHGDLASSAYAMATLFALDRAGAAAEIAELRRNYDVVILDRYVASNAAYSAARLREDAGGWRWPGSSRSNTSGWGCPFPTGRCCSRSRPTSPRSAPVAVPKPIRGARGTATNVTTNCSGAPAWCTHNWPPQTGTGDGWWSTPTSIRTGWRRL